jgi:hypothetical protein
MMSELSSEELTGRRRLEPFNEKTRAVGFLAGKIVSQIAPENSVCREDVARCTDLSVLLHPFADRRREREKMNVRVLDAGPAQRRLICGTVLEKQRRRNPLREELHCRVLEIAEYGEKGGRNPGETSVVSSREQKRMPWNDGVDVGDKYEVLALEQQLLRWRRVEPK